MATQPQQGMGTFIPDPVWPLVLAGSCTPRALAPLLWLRADAQEHTLGFEVSPTWVKIPTTLFIDWATLGDVFNFWVPQRPYL